MNKFKLGDEVKIIKRKNNNVTGASGHCYETNGDVGETGFVVNISTHHASLNTIYKIEREGKYFGKFDEEELDFNKVKSWKERLTNG